MYIFIMWLLPLLIYNGYSMYNKVGLPPSQQCVLYLYPQLLQPQWVYICGDVCVDRSGSYTRFTLYNILTVSLAKLTVFMQHHRFRFNENSKLLPNSFPIVQLHYKGIFLISCASAVHKAVRTISHAIKIIQSRL